MAIDMTRTLFHPMDHNITLEYEYQGHSLLWLISLFYLKQGVIGRQNVHITKVTIKGCADG